MHPRIRFVWPLLVALNACNGDVVGFDITQPIPERVIPGDPTANAAALAVASGNDMGLAIRWMASGPSVSTDGLARLDLKSLELDITASSQPPDDTDCWDFVYSAALSIESTREGSTLPLAQIASVSNPGCTSALVFTPTAQLDLLPYAREGYRIVVDISGVPPADDVSFDGRVVMRAGVL